MAVLILVNFFCSGIQLQFNFDEDSDRAFRVLEIVLSIIFLLELLLNMVTHWFLEFW
jgi:uncharacterized membrane protein